MRRLCGECGERPPIVTGGGRNRRIKHHELCSECARDERNRLRSDAIRRRDRWLAEREAALTRKQGR